MATNSKNKKVANKLLSLSLDEEGKVNKEKVQSVLASLRENPPSNHREILQHYLTATRRYLPSFQCGLEVPAGVDDQVNQTLSAKVNDSEGSNFSIERSQNPNLIAGYKLRVGDDVYEDSIGQRLINLRKSLS